MKRRRDEFVDHDEIEFVLRKRDDREVPCDAYGRTPREAMVDSVMLNVVVPVLLIGAALLLFTLGK